MFTVAQLAEKINAKLLGDGSACIKAIGPIEVSAQTDITFLSDPKKAGLLLNSKAGAVIVGSEVEGFKGPQLLVKDVNTALIEVLRLFAPKLSKPQAGIDSAAKIGKSAVIDSTASIGAFAVIADGVKIGRNTVICAGCKIGQNSSIGENCRLDDNAVVYHNCKIGNNVIIQANAVIGSTGFGYTFYPS